VIARLREPVLGLRENWQQFTLLVLVVGFVGSLVGLERTVVPLIGEREFGLTSKTAIVSFIITFGVVKALCNFFAGRISERWGRKRLLVLGWIIGLPVPFIIIYADRWFWFDVANVLLGINQALTWSMTVIMKIDLVGPRRRGLALGLNEFAGYLAVGIMAWLTGEIAARYSLRPQPFYLGIGIAVAGLLVSLFFVRETIDYARYEAHLQAASDNPRMGNPGPATTEKRSLKDIFLLTTWKERALSSCSQAGLVNNLNDGMSWGIYPLFFSSYGLGVAAIGVIKAVYPAVWGLLQPVTGPLSDRVGRKWLIAGGMAVQALGIWLIVLIPEYGWWIAGAVLQGIGTAMVYPVLLAAISDVAHPKWRATSLGVYRLWRDLGYAVGALLAGLIADLVGMGAAIHTIAAITLLSGLVVALRMYETLPGKRVISETREPAEVSSGKQEQYAEPLLADPPGGAPCMGCSQGK
jgi:MFS family permease